MTNFRRPCDNQGCHAQSSPPPPPPPHVHWDDVFSPDFWRRFGDTVWHITLILLIYALLRGLLRRLVRRGLEPVLLRGGQKMDPGQAARLKTLAGLIDSIVGYVLTFVFGVMLLRTVDLDPIPLLTTASVAGLAVGFGAQKLVKDVISGFFILLENQYAVGDYVTIGAATGTVEEVGMRTTRLRDDAGKLYILSNGDITQVVNQSRGAVESLAGDRGGGGDGDRQGDGDDQRRREGTGGTAPGPGFRPAPGGAGIGRHGRRETDIARHLPCHRPRPPGRGAGGAAE